MRIQTFVIVASALSTLTLLQSVVAAPGRRFKGHGRGNRESSTIKSLTKHRRLGGKGKGGSSSSDIKFENRFPCKYCGEGNDSKLTNGTINAGGACFSQDTTVQVQGVEEPVTMKDLTVGDFVLTTLNGLYEPVYAFAHKHIATEATFLQFHTKETTTNENNIIPLEMTGEHLVYLQGKANPVRADSVKVGNVLQSFKINNNDNNGNTMAATVLKIETVKRQGVYAPLTYSGTIVVNGILASNYISIQEYSKNTDEHLSLQGATVQIPIIPHHQFVHMTLAPFRILFRATRNTPGNDTTMYNKDGMPHYVSLGIGFNLWASRQHLFVHALVVLVAFLVTGPFLVLENALFLGDTVSMTLFAALGVVIAVWIALKKRILVVRKIKTA